MKLLGGLGQETHQGEDGGNGVAFLFWLAAGVWFVVVLLFAWIGRPRDARPTHERVWGAQVDSVRALSI